jgi:hypothetical protein
MSDPDLILRHFKSLAFEVRMTGDDEHVVFAALDLKAATCEW